MAITKAKRRKKIRLRVRKKISGTALRPRLAVYRSNKGIYCQLIDDLAGTTLLSASSQEVKDAANKTDQAKKVGMLIGQKALDQKIELAVFDRSGYLYHGRIKALAEGAREKGLKL